VLRHELRGKVAPIAMSLHARRVQSGAPPCALKRRPGSLNLYRPACSCARASAVALPSITPLANPNLPPASRPRTTKDPIPLVDHQRPARQFLDKRRESIDTVTTVARPRGAPESSDLESGLSPFLAGAGLVVALNSPGPIWRAVLALRRDQRRNYADRESHRQAASLKRLLARVRVERGGLSAVFTRRPH
jgi:hypothetical protein